MDSLSYVLQGIRLKTAIYGTVWLRPPWGVRIAGGEAAVFHAVTAGRCTFRLDDERSTIEVATGDVIVVPHGHAHTFQDDPLSPVRTIDLAAAARSGRRPPRQKAGGEATATGVVCGQFWFEDDKVHPLVATLPAAIHLRAADDARAADWFEPMLRFVAHENDRSTAGGDAIVTRFADVIVLQAIRTHLASMPLDERRWARALTDDKLCAALRLLHEHPEKPWTVAELARRAATSRSALAVRFATLIGEPPLQYLTRLRMHRAERLLRANGASLAEIASSVGYATEAAFSRAFKRAAGVAPGAYRRRSVGK